MEEGWAYARFQQGMQKSNGIATPANAKQNRSGERPFPTAVQLVQKDLAEGIHEAEVGGCCLGGPHTVQDPHDFAHGGG
jgi:hypothetical protein